MSQQFEWLYCWCYWWKCAVGMVSGGMMYLPNFMRIDSGDQAILLVCFTNLEGRNVSITGVWDLWTAPLKWTQIAYTNFHDWFKHVSNIRILPQQLMLVLVLVLMLVLLIKGIYEVGRWVEFIWHYAHTKFHDDWYSRSSNIKILLQIRGTVILVLLIWMYELYR